MPIIITIGREFGSGGRELGRRLSDELGIPYYDKEILDEVAKDSPYAKSYIEEVSESKPYIPFPIHYGATYSQYTPFNQSVDVIAQQSKTIKRLAMTSSCVIVGRAADYVLKEMNPIRIFVYADMEAKIARCRSRETVEHLSDSQIKRNINKVEKGRKSFYEFYTGQKWGDKENYDILINTTGKDLKKLAKDLAHLFK